MNSFHFDSKFQNFKMLSLRKYVQSKTAIFLLSLWTVIIASFSTDLYSQPTDCGVNVLPKAIFKVGESTQITSQDTAMVKLLFSSLSRNASLCNNVQFTTIAYSEIALDHLIDSIKVVLGNPGMSRNTLINTNLNFTQLADGMIKSLNGTSQNVAATQVQNLLNCLNPLFKNRTFRLVDFITFNLDLAKINETVLNPLDILFIATQYIQFSWSPQSTNAITVSGQMLGIDTINNVMVRTFIKSSPSLVIQGNSSGSSNFVICSGGYRLKIESEMNYRIPSSLISALVTNNSYVISGVSFGVENVTYYLDIDPSCFTVQTSTINACDEQVTVSVQRGNFNIYTGQISDAVFFSSSSINFATHVTNSSMVSGVLTSTNNSLPSNQSTELDFLLALRGRYNYIGGSNSQSIIVNGSSGCDGGILQGFLRTAIDTLYMNAIFDVSVSGNTAGHTADVINPLSSGLSSVVINNIKTPLLFSISDKIIAKASNVLSAGIGNTSCVTILDYKDCPICYGSIGNLVFYDTNDNGVYDGDDTGIHNVIVELLNGSGTLLSRDTTGFDGLYSFEKLSTGPYQIRLLSSSIPDGLKVTTQNTGSDPSLDSNISPTTFTSNFINITADGLGISRRDTTVDIGLTDICVLPTIRNEGYVPSTCNGLIPNNNTILVVDANNATKYSLNLGGNYETADPVFVGTFNVTGLPPASSVTVRIYNKNGNCFVDQVFSTPQKICVDPNTTCDESLAVCLKIGEYGPVSNDGMRLSFFGFFPPQVCSNVDFTQIRGARLSFNELFQELQSITGLSESNLLSSNITLRQFGDAIRNVLIAKGFGSAANEINDLLNCAYGSSAGVPAMRLNQFLFVDLPLYRLSTIGIDALDLIVSASQVVAFNRTAWIPQSFDIGTGIIPLPIAQGIANINVAFFNMSLPVIACGSQGMRYCSGGFRFKLGVDLLNFAPDLNFFNIPFIRIGFDIALLDADLFFEISPTCYTIREQRQNCECIDGTITGGGLKFYLGQIRTDQFYNRNASITFPNNVPYAQWFTARFIFDIIIPIPFVGEIVIPLGFGLECNLRAAAEYVAPPVDVTVCSPFPRSVCNGINGQDVIKGVIRSIPSRFNVNEKIYFPLIPQFIQDIIASATEFLLSGLASVILTPMAAVLAEAAAPILGPIMDAVGAVPGKGCVTIYGVDGCHVTNAIPSNVVCFDQTSSITSDNRIRFNVNVTSTDPARTNFTAEVVNGLTTISPTTGVFNVGTTFTLGEGTAGSGSTYTIRIRDTKRPGCFNDVVISDPGNCLPPVIECPAPRCGVGTVTIINN